MSVAVLDLARSLRDTLAAFDADVLSADACADVAEQLAATEKACAAARALAALRATDCGVHRRRGYASGAEWMGRSSGTSVGEARAALATAGALGRCPSTLAAVVTGELSLGQAGVITRTEAECPGSEAELVGVARRRVPASSRTTPEPSDWLRCHRRTCTLASTAPGPSATGGTSSAWSAWPAPCRPTWELG